MKVIHLTASPLPIGKVVYFSITDLIVYDYTMARYTLDKYRHSVIKHHVGLYVLDHWLFL